MLERRETAGESRPIRKMKYMPSQANGMRRVISSSRVMTEASTILNVPLSRPGVGCRSCQMRSVHVVTESCPFGYLTTVTAVAPIRKRCGSGSSMRMRTGNRADRCTQLSVRSILRQAAGDPALFGKTP